MPFITERTGNIFDTDMTVIIHQANCFNVMGAGIAKEVKMRYPEAFLADRDHPIPIGSKERLGRHSFAWVDDHSRLIVNAYGQHRYGRDKKYTDETALLSAIKHVFDKLNVLKTSNPDFPVRVGIPSFIGCGLAGGDWKVVSEGIEQLAEDYNFPVYFYRLR